MKLDYSVKGQVIIDMVDYVESIVTSFPSEYLNKTVTSPWNENLTSHKKMLTLAKIWATPQITTKMDLSHQACLRRDDSVVC
jgi:hypothetical protein